MYTRRGDKGETSLYGARRVAKDSPRVEAYGAIDELNSLLGVVISQSSDAKVNKWLIEVQKLLFVAGADAACEMGASRSIPRITSADTAWLEKKTDELLRELPTLKNFILPGGSAAGAYLQFTRSVCRRVERRIVTASRGEGMNPELVPFFNRLSSFLFNLSRFVNKKASKKEAVWKA